MIGKEIWSPSHWNVIHIFCSSEGRRKLQASEEGIPKALEGTGDGGTLIISIFQNFSESFFQKENAWYSSPTTKMRNLLFTRYKKRSWSQRLHIPCRVPPDITPTPMLSHSMVGGEEWTPSGWCHGQRGQIRWTVLRKCLPSKSRTRRNEQNWEL